MIGSNQLDYHLIFFSCFCEFFRAKINEVRQRIRESKIDGGKDMIDLHKRKIDDCLKITSDASRTIYEERLLKDVCDHAFEKLNLNRIRLMVS